MRFGELMVSQGLISEEQLEECLRLQVHGKKKLGTVLVESGYVTERQIVEVLEFQLGYPSVSLFDEKLEEAAVRLIPEGLARKHGVIPIRLSGGKLVLAMEDPLDYNAIEEVRLASGLAVQPMIATRTEIDQAITRMYGLQESVDEMLIELAQPLEEDAEKEAQNMSSPVVRLVNQIIQAAVVQQASDIHIEPGEREVVVRFRVDGALRTEKKLPKNMQPVLTARLKILARLNIAERRLPQDGRIQLTVDARKIDIRVSTLPGVDGESIVLRILDQSSGIKRLSEIGFSPRHFRLFEQALYRPNGIVLITGPTGSGKTSTLYSALQELNRPDVKIVTVEDPVEYRMDGITQVQVQSSIGLTFASGLRSILRQDPNIVMVGEIRDAETAEIAVRASLTGHLVLSTLHTNSAVATISRLADMGVEPYLLASSLACIVAQRLVRRVCRDCAVKVPMREEERQLFAAHGIVPDQAAGQAAVMLLRGQGCANCNKTGYKGRIAVHEVLKADEGLRRLIAHNAEADKLLRHAREHGFRTMLEDGLEKVLAGLTTTEELLKSVSAED